jgi:phenylacetate-CoA ligase
MTKAQMMDELDDVYTDRRLTGAAVEAALAATGDEPVPLPGGHIALASGGSSGRRGTFVFDPNGLRQYVGSLTRGLMARLAQTGGSPDGLHVAIVAAASPVHPTGLAEPLTRVGGLPRWYAVPATLALPEIVERLNELQAPIVHGYPTMLARLADEQRAGRLRITPTAVTSSSETLTAELRGRITAGFHAPIVDAFGSSEGLVGAAPPGDEAITFAEDGCVVELVDSANRPVPPGTASAKVLVTNLYNRVQPLIRYELADVFVQHSYARGHGYLRARVQGRADETFRYADLEVHPFVVRSVLVQEPGIAEYQVRQAPRGIDVDAVAGPDLDTDAVARRLCAALAAAGLDGPRVTVTRVGGLARHPQTGKLPRFVPLR